MKIFLMYAIALSLLIATPQLAVPQTAPSVTLTLTGSGVGDIWKANTSCGAASAAMPFNKIASITNGTYTDTVLQPGGTYCYYAMQPGNSPTYPWQVVVPVAGTAAAATPQANLSVTVQ